MLTAAEAEGIRSLDPDLALHAEPKAVEIIAAGITTAALALVILWGFCNLLAMSLTAREYVKCGHF